MSLFWAWWFYLSGVTNVVIVSCLVGWLLFLLITLTICRVGAWSDRKHGEQ